MADVIALLRANGILRPEITLKACALAGLELASGCVSVMGESGGGRMIYGHDGVDPRGFYVKGGPVTRANYLPFMAAVKAGTVKRQGVGDCQLTSAEYTDRGDSLGGCWDPLANQRAGFTGLARLQRAYGVQQGFRRYNGSGPAAEKYGRDKTTQRDRWARILGGAAGIPAATNLPAPAAPTPAVPPPVIPRDDDPVFSPQITRNADGSFRAAANVEAGNGSIYAQAWAFLGSVWGDTEVALWAQDGNGRLLERFPPDPNNTARARVKNNTRLTWTVPAGTRLVTWEGRVLDPAAGTIITPSGVGKLA